MIYPYNTHKATVNAGKVTNNDLFKFWGILFCIFAVGLFFLLEWVFSTLIGLPKMVGLIVALLIAVTMLIYAFRFIIFKEQDKMEDYQGQQSDAFTRYSTVRIDSENYITIHNNKVLCYEYGNGNTFCVLQFRFGSNDTAKAATTQAVFKAIMHTLCMFELEFRTIDTPENFYTSLEYQKHIKHLNEAKEKEHANHRLKVADYIYRECAEQSNVPCIFLIISTKNGYQLPDLESAVIQILALIRSNVSAFRSINFLDKGQLLEMYRDFYELETIDLTTMKTIELSSDVQTAYIDVVSVFKVVSTTGKTFADDSVLENKFKNKARRI